MTTDTTAGELASIEAVARMLCHEPTARRIADQIDAPSFDESSEPVQLYWLALAAALQPAAADLVVVPRVPTEVMVKAVDDVLSPLSIAVRRAHAGLFWSAMVAAAPSVEGGQSA